MELIKNIKLPILQIYRDKTIFNELKAVIEEFIPESHKTTALKEGDFIVEINRYYNFKDYLIVLKEFKEDVTVISSNPDAQDFKVEYVLNDHMLLREWFEEESVIVIKKQDFSDFIGDYLDDDEILKEDLMEIVKQYTDNQTAIKKQETFLEIFKEELNEVKYLEPLKSNTLEDMVKDFADPNMNLKEDLSNTLDSWVKTMLAEL